MRFEVIGFAGAAPLTGACPARRRAELAARAGARELVLTHLLPGAGAIDVARPA